MHKYWGWFAGAVLLTACSTVPTAPGSPCAGNLDDKDTQIACHDYAYQSASTDPNGALTTFDKLCREQKMGRACANQAYFIDNPPPGRPQNSPEAVLLYRRACELGDGAGCHNLADLYFQGRGTVMDQTLGVEALQKSCDLDYAAGCYRVAVIRLHDQVLKNDPLEVARLMKKGCALGDAVSCNDLSYLLMEGKGIPRDHKAALQAVMVSCELGLPRGCGTLGSLYLEGAGPEGTDYAKAFEYIQRACDGNDAPSCSNLGYLIETGKGAVADPGRAAQYYSKACDGGSGLGCGNLGILLADGRGVPKDDVTALPNLERGCADQAPEACRYLADFHEHARGKLPTSKVTAKHYRKRACELGDVPSCARLAEGFKSLCEKGESQILSCQTGQKRMVSVCSVGAGLPMVVYRFGTPARVELQYDGTVAYQEEHWADGEKRSLSFVREGGTRYRIDETIQRTQDPPLKKVEIFAGEKTKIDCRYPILGSLNSDSIRKAKNLQGTSEGVH